MEKGEIIKLTQKSIWKSQKNQKEISNCVEPLRGSYIELKKYLPKSTAQGNTQNPRKWTQKYRASCAKHLRKAFTQKLYANDV